MLMHVWLLGETLKLNLCVDMSSSRFTDTSSGGLVGNLWGLLWILTQGDCVDFHGCKSATYEGPAKLNTHAGHPHQKVLLTQSVPESWHSACHPRLIKHAFNPC